MQTVEIKRQQQRYSAFELVQLKPQCERQRRDDEIVWGVLLKKKKKQVSVFGEVFLCVA